MNDRNKWIKLMAVLLEATQKDQIKWSLKPPPEGFYQTVERTDQVYETSFKNQRFRIYPYSYKHWVDEDRFEWSESVKLEFTDQAGRSVFSVPQVEGIHDLLEAVKYQCAGIDQFFENLTS